MTVKIKVLHVSFADYGGGAARAAYRIHRAQVKSGIDSYMLVLHKRTDDDRIKQAKRTFLTTTSKIIRRCLHNYRQRACSTDKPVYLNFGNNSAGLVHDINTFDAEIINLHWVCNMLSVKDIARLRKPIVWTFHDMWPFCGGEHYAPEGENARFQCGYRAENRPESETGPDLSRKTWENKCRFWSKQNFTMVCPSRWLANCTRQSFLFGDKKINVIPNPLELETIWRPLDRNAARTVLELPMDKKLVLFGAIGGVSDPRKGADLLRKTILQIAEKMPGEIELLIYGQSENKEGDVWPCPVHWLGKIRDDRVLAQAYSAADVMIVPSRQDNLPNTAIEAQACGTPVAAFNVGGLPDIVDHRETGWLANAFDTMNLAEGILWLLAEDVRLADLSAAARKRAVERYGEMVIARAYGDLYKSTLDRSVL